MRDVQEAGGGAPGRPGGDRRRAGRTRTFIRAAILLPDVHPEPWECVVLDLSPMGCAVYFEEQVPAHALVLLTLPGLASPVEGRVVLDRGDVKHIGFTGRIDAAAVARTQAAVAAAVAKPAAEGGM